MTVGTRIMTWLRGEQVGTDAFGNRYYRDKSKRKLERGGGRFSREKRWVIYKAEVEATRVPPEWHAWLHHTVNEIPTDGGKLKYTWQKLHQPKAGHAVTRVFDKAQQRQHVLDMRRIEEFQTAKLDEGNISAGQLDLKRPTVT